MKKFIVFALSCVVSTISFADVWHNVDSCGSRHGTIQEIYYYAHGPNNASADAEAIFTTDRGARCIIKLNGKDIVLVSSLQVGKTIAVLSNKSFIVVEDYNSLPGHVIQKLNQKLK